MRCLAFLSASTFALMFAGIAPQVQNINRTEFLGQAGAHARNPALPSIQEPLVTKRDRRPVRRSGPTPSGSPSCRCRRGCSSVCRPWSVRHRFLRRASQARDRSTLGLSSAELFCPADQGGLPTMTWIGRSCWRSARALLTGSQFFGNPVLSVCRLNVSVKYDALERLIGDLGAAPPVERLFDMNGGDVIGEQNDLVGVKLCVVFPREIGLPDQARTGSAGPERCRCR